MCLYSYCAVRHAAAGQSRQRSLAIIVDAEQPLPAPVVREMRLEMDRLLRAPALAFTHVTGGPTQPFAVVLCDRVAAAIRPAMWGSDFRRADLLLAHESTSSASNTNTAPKALQARPLRRDLIAESLDFHPRDLQRLRASTALEAEPETADSVPPARAARD